MHTGDRDHSFAALALAAIERSPVLTRLEGRRAIVLERIAAGAGSTNWYLIERPEQLGALAMRLRWGSLVSFYFDDRFSEGTVEAASIQTIIQIAAEDHDAVVATRTSGVELLVDFVSDRGELDDFLAHQTTGATLIYGRFPDAGNDGFAAVTIALPDDDGVVRPHPY